MDRYKNTPKDCWVYLMMGCDVEALEWLIKNTHHHAAIVMLERKQFALDELKEIKITFDHPPTLNNPHEQRPIFVVTDNERQALHAQLGAVGDRWNRSVHVMAPRFFHDTDWWKETVEKLHDYQECQRTLLMTAMTNSYQTHKNLVENIPAYITERGIKALKDRHKGQPAICIAAGPSVDKHLEMLGEETEMNSVYISCLTMYKPGIKNNIIPDYVTALDYHEVSGRFFEGFDLEGVLVTTDFILEPKVNNAVVKNIPDGALTLFIGNEWLNLLLGDQDDDKTHLNSGATVAHFSFALAVQMGCDPIIMVGQDLGFTDSKYYPECVYKAHAWKETSRGLAQPSESRPIRVAKTASGDDIYTDEQMHTYLEIFEGMWAACDAWVVDCTEGGVAKENVNETMPLAEALETYCRHPIEIEPLPEDSWTPDVPHAIEKIEKALEDIDCVIYWTQKALNWYLQLEGNWEDKELFDKAKAGLIEGKKHIDECSATRQMLMEYSGIATYIEHWRDTQTEMMNLDGNEKRDAQVKRDTEHHGCIIHAGEEMKEHLQKCLDKLKQENNHGTD